MCTWIILYLPNNALNNSLKLTMGGPERLMTFRLFKNTIKQHFRFIELMTAGRAS